MSPVTLEAFRDHGQVRPSLEENVDVARDIMGAVEEAGISMRDITEHLLDDGVQLFAQASDKLLAALGRKAA
jgi:transaldolase/glucose-6-phosphate isomerase